MMHAFISTPWNNNATFLRQQQQSPLLFQSRRSTNTCVRRTGTIIITPCRRRRQQQDNDTVHHHYLITPPRFSLSSIITMSISPQSPSSSSSCPSPLTAASIPSRRNFLVTHILSPLILFSLIFLPLPNNNNNLITHAAPTSLSTKQLAATLSPIINLYDSLSVLATDIQAGTNADVRRVVRTLQKGIDINAAVRPLVKALPSNDAEIVRVHARECVEFLNQVVDYFDSTQLKQKPPADVLNFSLMAVDKARAELDLVLKVFPKDVVEEARRLVTSY